MDDDELFRTLRRALAQERAAIVDAAPAHAQIVESGLAAWPWRTMDEELAELVYESADQPASAGLRGGSAPPRQLTFVADAVRLELEVGPRGVLGQLLPPQVMHVELLTPAGLGREWESDGQGRFVIEPAPTGPVRLRCLLSDARRLVTGWTLL